MNLDREAINHKLKKFYEFDDDDLYANQNGRLTPRQTQLLKNRGQVIRQVGYALAGLFAAIALCVGGLFLFTLLLDVLMDEWRPSTSTIPLIASCLGTLATAGIAGFIFFTTQKRGKSSGVLRSLSGPLQVRVVELTSTTTKGSRSRKYKQYQMSIGGSSEFVLDDELLGVVKDGAEYAIHFMDFQNGTEGLILSMEKL